MKKFIVILAAVVIAATVWATNQVTSINVAGYVKFNLDRGKFYMLRNDFFAMGDADNSVSNIIGRQLPQDSRIYTWNSAGGGSYVASTYSRYFSGGWKTNWVPGTNRLHIGAGFWVLIPAGAALPSYTLNILGEVPNNPTSIVPLASTFSMLGYSYPTAIAWTNTTLAKSAKLNDKIFYWDPSINNYRNATYSKYFSGGWKTNWTGDNIILEVGRGFWYQKTALTNLFWVENRPYNID